MTDQEYIEMKADYIEFVTKFITKHGGLGPSITVLGTRKNDGKTAIVHCPIPGKFMDSEGAKDEFVDEVVPQMAKKIAEDFTTNAVAWASEAWLRVMEKDKASEQQLKDWKSLPVKKEVLIITIETDKGTDTCIQEIVRKGKQVNEDGELVDHVELLDLPEYNEGVAGQGRFTGLLKIFTKNQ